MKKYFKNDYYIVVYTSFKGFIDMELYHGSLLLGYYYTVESLLSAMKHFYLLKEVNKNEPATR